MSYHEENGQVVLTMSREDYERLLMCLGSAAGAASMGRGALSVNSVFGLLNRINKGNPHYTPYPIPPEQKAVNS
jgi:hypothetical protein